METIIVELTHNKALQLLQDLEDMKIIRLLKSNRTAKDKLSDKYRGILSKAEGKALNQHIHEMRSEWNNS